MLPDERAPSFTILLSTIVGRRRLTGGATLAICVLISHYRYRCRYLVCRTQRQHARTAGAIDYISHARMPTPMKNGAEASADFALDQTLHEFRYVITPVCVHTPAHTYIIYDMYVFIHVLVML